MFLPRTRTLVHPLTGNNVFMGPQHIHLVALFRGSTTSGSTVPVTPQRGQGHVSIAGRMTSRTISVSIARAVVLTLLKKVAAYSCNAHTLLWCTHQHTVYNILV